MRTCWLIPLMLIVTSMFCTPGYCATSGKAGGTTFPSMYVPLDISGKCLLLYYYRVGVCFVVDAGSKSVKGVLVFPGTEKQTKKQVQPDEVVPGLGAFGAKLGSKLNSPGFPFAPEVTASSPSSPQWPHYAVLKFENGRHLYLTMDKDFNVLSLTATGPFVMQGGINERSNFGVIIDSYGQPDNMMVIPSASGDNGTKTTTDNSPGARPAGSFIETGSLLCGLLALLLLGIVFGLLIRYARRRARVLEFREQH